MTEIVVEAGVVAAEEAKTKGGRNSLDRILRQNLHKVPGVVDPALLRRNQDHRPCKLHTPDRRSCRRYLEKPVKYNIRERF